MQGMKIGVMRQILRNPVSQDVMDLFNKALDDLRSAGTACCWDCFLLEDCKSICLEKTLDKC